MPKAYPNQTSFASGELSPLMSGQVGSDVYETGASVMSNMIADPRGPAITRDSTEHIVRIIADTEARIETFNRTNSEIFTFVIVHEALLFVRNVNFPVVLTFTAPWQREEVKDIYIVPLPDGRSFYLLHPDHPPYELIDNLGRLKTDTFAASGDFTVPPDVTEIFYCLTAGGGGGGGGFEAFAGGPSNAYESGAGGGGGGSVKGTATVTPGQVLPIVIGVGGVGGNKGGEIEAVPATNGTTGTASTFSGATAQPGQGGTAGNISPSIGGAGGSLGGNGGGGGRIHSGNVSRTAVAGGVSNATCDGAANAGGTVNVGAGSGGGGGGGGQIEGARGGLSNAPPPTPGPGGGGGGGGFGGPFISAGTNGGRGGGGNLEVSYEETAGSVTLLPVIFTDPPADWGLGNWPACGAYFQSRLWLANTRFKNETFWASKTGDPKVFTLDPLADPDTPPRADYAMEFTLENFGAINWMVGAKVLLIGTSNGEYFLTSSTGVLVPGDIAAIQQSAYGSAPQQPIKIGDQVIYVSPDRRKIRAMNYEERKTNWMSTDLTLPSEHITKGGIKKLAWSQHPHNLLWVTLMDGTMCALSYERGNDIKGWHRHETQGKVLSASAGFNGKRSVLILGIERTPGQVELERMSDGHYFDAWNETGIFNDSVVGFTYVEGFDHLDGMLAQVIVEENDGTRLFYEVVVAAESTPGAGDGDFGRIFFPFTPNARLASAGLGFTATVAPMGLGQGLMAAFKKRRNKVYVEIVDSGAPLLNGKREAAHDSTSLSALDTATRSVEETIIGWDRGAIVTISQDLPVPLTVTAILGEVKQNAL